MLGLMAGALGEQPLAFGRLLGALELAVNPGHEIAVIGDPADEATAALLAEVHRRFLPTSVVAAAAPATWSQPAPKAPPGAAARGPRAARRPAGRVPCPQLRAACP